MDGSVDSKPSLAGSVKHRTNDGRPKINHNANGRRPDLWRQQHHHHPAPSSDSPSSPNPDVYQTKPKRVVIVEDVESLSNLYRHLLESRGHSVVACVTSGEELLDILRRHLDVSRVVDVAILDYRLGGMNGFDVAKELVKLCPAAKVIFASAEESIQNEAKAAGFTFLRKPFELGVLIKDVEEK